jgi:signal transduction histidine kinase
MTKHFPHWRPLADWAATVVTFIILMMYSYAFLFHAPYAGINWSPSTGIIAEVIVPGALQPGDQLLQIGAVSVADYAADLRLTLLGDARAGQGVPVRVGRGDRTLNLDWIYPGFTYPEFASRLPSQWWLAFVFWAVGAFVLMMLRPRDTRQLVFAAANFLTAIWLAASAPSQWHIWYSAIVLRAAMWLCVPAYWHLHWLVPQPLGRLPKAVVWGGYLAGLALAAAEFLQLIPHSLYAIGLVLALLGSLALLIIRLILRPAQRRSLFWLGAAATLAFLPGILVGLVTAALGSPAQSALAALMFLPILPLAYLYAAYRQQLGGLELRANLIISVYLFLTLVGAALFVLVALLQGTQPLPNQSVAALLIATTLTALGTIFGFAPFQRFVEHRLLGVPLIPAKLIETYAARITTSADRPTLAHLLRDEVLPTLLVRQSALIWLADGTVMYSQPTAGLPMPTPADMPALLTDTGVYRPQAKTPASLPLAWVHLGLTLSVEHKPIAVWLLGRRDPDDFYSQADLTVLRTLAHQTAIALTNISQAESLRTLYQANIEQDERQRLHLAHELHDHTLNGLANLKTSVDEHQVPPAFFDHCDAIIAELRQLVSGLRPALLAYGLGVALQAFAEDLAERELALAQIGVELDDQGARYEAHIEQHLYRIVQQACENALQHAQPQNIRIGGRLAPQQIELTIVDDGRGFDGSEKLDVAELVTRKHYGLAGMFERAAIIGADLQVDSVPGCGTKVQLTWPRKA